ncbi:carboxylating nicotinate-nucleotide diphosphorylase [archaeon]|nr:MAG: carboxylating nicotinate-nucleotide diphosphorylase [archaeon]
MSQFKHLLPPSYKREAVSWVEDDCPSFDIGGFVVGDKVEIAYIYCKEPCVLAGVPFVNAVLDHLGLIYQWNFEEGDELESAEKIIVASVSGQCSNLLIAERTCLNILSRASGVATLARTARQIKEQHNWHGYVAGTRKTTPGFRTVEKYALLVGGVATHRLDLSQMVMLKDNHVWSTGSITNAVKKARSAGGFFIKIEVECNSIEEAMEAGAAGADIIMLDNFSSMTIHGAAEEIKKHYPYVLIEASGVSV